MASWMIHFRVAQALLDAGALGESPDPIKTAFVLGNIAPDSGVPTPDGQGYLPNKNTSHFMRRFEGVPAGQNPERCDPALFAAQWLPPAAGRCGGDSASVRPADDPEAIAFYLGYLAHLVTDNAWVKDFIYPAKVRFAHLRFVDGAETPEGIARFYAFLKRDWYDMDFLYLRRHPDLPAYRLFLEAPSLENRFLPFFPADAFERKRREMRAFYRNGVATVKERAVYIRDEEAAEFVARVVGEVLREFGELFSAACSKLTPYSQIDEKSMVQLVH